MGLGMMISRIGNYNGNCYGNGKKYESKGHSRRFLVLTHDAVGLQANTLVFSCELHRVQKKSDIFVLFIYLSQFFDKFYETFKQWTIKQWLKRLAACVSA